MTALIIIVFIVFTGVSLLILLSGIALYARLVKLRTIVSSSWSKIDSALSSVADFSPDLKDKLDLQGLQMKLKGLRDNIETAVNDYNKAAQDYNTAIETFPAQILAKIFQLEKARVFDTKIS